MSQYEATIYRRRAANLRALAHRLAATPSMHLQRYASVDTWFGPRPDACAVDLTRAQHAIHAAVDDLRRQALMFERRADELDAAAIS